MSLPSIFSALALALLLYTAGFTLSVLSFWFASRPFMRGAGACMLAGVLANAAAIGSLWLSTGTFPAARPFGFFAVYALLTVIWSLVTCWYWGIENTYFTFVAFPVACLFYIWRVDPAVASRSHLTEFFLSLHLMAILLSMAAFTMAFAGGLMLFIQDRLMKAKSFGFLMENLPSLELLDDLTYRNLILGFGFLSVGTVLGFAGAPQAWGSYLPINKQVLFGVVVWCVYGFYLHSRTRLGWRGKRLAYFALVGFLIILVASLSATYYGAHHGS
jgi:ABC-type transport system involved in cytochrome c biogenesis permease subunit